MMLYNIIANRLKVAAKLIIITHSQTHYVSLDMDVAQSNQRRTYARLTMHSNNDSKTIFIK